MFNKKEAIEFLMALQGVKEGIFQQIEATVEVIRQLSSKHPDKVEKVVDNFRRYAAADIDGVTARMVDAMSNVFTDEELEAVYNFYSTDVGKSLIAKLPLMVIAGQGMADAFTDQIVKWTEKAMADAGVAPYGEYQLDL